MRNSAVKLLVGANVAVYLMQYVLGPGFEASFALWPLHHPYFRIWQIVTYAFLHDTQNLAHIFFNMFGVFMFGTEIERNVGPRRLLACYFASVVSAALAQLIVPPLLGAPSLAAVGASGGVFGLLLAYALMFPHRKVIPLIPPIPMPAWLFATVYAALEFFFSVTGSLSGVAHFAHLGGMIGSALVVSSWRFAR
jgi:rhomboid family protein